MRLKEKERRAHIAKLEAGADDRDLARRANMFPIDFKGRIKLKAI